MRKWTMVRWPLALLVCLSVPGSWAAEQLNVMDKVLAVVGNEPLLDSDVEVELMQLRAQGQQADSGARCNLFELLLVQKLLLAQARLDSLKVNEMAVTSELEQRVRYFTAQLGGTQEVERYFGKPLFQLKESWRQQLNDRNLTQQMQMKIVSAVAVTPRDAETFYESQPQDSFPMVPEQFVIRQIVRYPPSGSEVRFQVRERLLELRERVMKGEKFQALAVMYSEDLSSARRGGELGMRSREEFVKPFADVAFALKVGQVSQIVETEFGFHLIQMIEKKGELANLRHILIHPKFSPEAQQRTLHLLDSVATLIHADSITFEGGVLRFSEDKGTRMSGGYVVNPQTQSTRFDKDQLMPADYFVLRNMAVGDLSAPYESKDRSGNDVVKIVKIEELIPAHRASFKQDYTVVFGIAQSKRQQEKFEEWITRRITSSYIFIDPDMRHCKLSREGWVK